MTYIVPPQYYCPNMDDFISALGGTKLKHAIPERLTIDEIGDNFLAAAKRRLLHGASKNEQSTIKPTTTRPHQMPPESQSRATGNN